MNNLNNYQLTDDARKLLTIYCKKYGLVISIYRTIFSNKTKVNSELYLFLHNELLKLKFSEVEAINRYIFDYIDNCNLLEKIREATCYVSLSMLTAILIINTNNTEFFKINLLSVILICISNIILMLTIDKRITNLILLRTYLSNNYDFKQNQFSF